ncbi:yjeF N-terminal domain-containing protein 3 isoform 1-T1 [Dama dama]|uniref:yjeF N-terminal domain-containing protein 3 isoform X1 n=1 Tax=Dama dama TaxID=30532 RepID=UPI002A36F70B|nr:yjeF N-terminal domain-containing protein 3 isoform X1 [Dama dama]
MGPGLPCSVGCQMCLDFFLPLLKPCLSAASLFRLGVFSTGVPVGWMGDLYRSVPGWRGAQQRRVHLHAGQDPVAGVMSPSLSFQTLFPCQYLELWDSRHSTGSSTPGTKGLSPLALYNQWPCAAPLRRLLIGGHTEWAGGRTPLRPGVRLKGCGSGGGTQITCAMSSTDGPDLAEAPKERCFLSTAEAAALERELLEDYRFGRQQLVEWCGHASAVAVTKAFPLPALPRKQRTALVVCGPEQNGAVGLVCARHLRVFEYEPTIFYPTRSLDPLHRDLTTQCEKMDIPFLSYLPAEVQLINNAYRLVVDAVLGPGVEPGEVGGPCTRALATLKLLSIPLVSLDIPSGWDPETGGDAEDGLRPDVLVSLAAPKRCAGRFSGRHHFVAGRFVPDDVRRKFALRLPGYTGTDCIAAL